MAGNALGAKKVQRDGKNLRNQFPFNQPGALQSSNQGHGDHHDHHDHHDHQNHQNHQNQRGAASARPASNSRQGAANKASLGSGAVSLALPSRNPKQRAGDDVPLDIGSIAAAGERCIDKVVMVEETEYDDVIECKHSYSERCHTTYTTDFEPQQEEECEENFKKSCFIEYKKVASQAPIKFCNTPLVCEGEGPVECRTVYESQCETRFHEHDVQDDVVDCETVYEEKCEDVTQGYTTEQKCTRWPKQECQTRRENVKKYSPTD